MKDLLGWGGIYAALTTPMAADGAVDVAALGRNLGRYAKRGLKGYLVLGSSGEAILLDDNEKLAVLRTAAVSAEAGARLLAGTGEESLRATIAMSKAAAAMGYAAVVVRTPHYYKGTLTQAALTAFYKAVADACPVPVLLYNIPPLTGLDLSLETTLELTRHPNIAGLKDSSGNLERLVFLEAALERTRPEFCVLVGGAATLYPSLAVGATGAILALAAAAPEAALRIHAASQRGDAAAALREQRAVLRAAHALAQTGMAGLKAAVEIGGFEAGPARAPIAPLSRVQREQVEAAFAPLRSAASAC